MTVAGDIKDRLDAVELIAETVKLRRSGNSYTGFCPFHDNKNTPAFVVWPDTGTWKCFGACNDGGDVFSFLMKKEGWDFAEALRYLARRSGVELQPQSSLQKKKQEENEHLYQLLALAAKFYQDQLHNNDAAHGARDHLLTRGILDEICERFAIGYAPDSWNAGLTYFSTHGYNVSQMVAAGLVIENEKGRTFDRFRHRIMMPIRDQRGRTVGFGARVVNPEDAPKFMNSPQTELFDKGAMLYGIDRAYRAVREKQSAVLVEGYMDVIAAHQAGFTNVISSMGTALTEKQLRLVKRYARRLVLALDSDIAGDRATMRSLSVARETIDRESAPAFDPRGLVKNEGQLKLEIQVATLPAGTDPDELIAQDAMAWRKLIEEAKAIVDYVIEIFVQGRDLKNSKVKAEIIDDVMPIINDVSHPAERSDYQQKLARLLHMDERVLMGSSSSTIPSRTSRKVSGVKTSAKDESRVSEVALAQDELETYLLAALVCNPDLLAVVDRSLRQSGSSALSPQDFSQSAFQIIFSQIRDALHQAAADPSDHLRDNLDQSIQDQLVELLTSGDGIDFQDERRISDLLQAAVRLRGRNIGMWLTELRFLEQTASEQGDTNGAAKYQAQTITHTKSLQGIQRFLARQSRREKVADGLAF